MTHTTPTRRLVPTLGPFWLACLLAGCSGLGQAPREPLAAFPAPAKGDGGVEIARTSMVPGATRQAGKPGEVADCFGPGLGVRIETSRGIETRLFDANGEPCDSATLLFDGRRPTGQRQADPRISLQIHDNFGAILDEREAVPSGRANRPASLPPLPQITVAESLAEAAPTQAADPLTAVLDRWQRHDTLRGVPAAESPLAASTRELNRMVSAVADESSGAAAAALAAQLRDRERLLEDERRRHAATLAASAQNRALTQATRDAFEQEQNRLQSELNAAQARAQQFEQLASRLKTEKARQEATMGERIATLSGSLQLAEAQAEASRRELILQAAAKVAEAQALATAARLDTQNDQLAEASRLQAQANELMDKVLQARTDAALEPQAGPTAPADLPLTEAPVVLQARERTLPEILTEVLQQAAAHSGAWRAEWQLGTRGQTLLQERWSLTAEATVGEILAQLNQQVQPLHGFSLAFTPFPQTRVLVVTERDVTPAKAPTTPVRP